MAVAVDATSPARFAGTPADNVDITSGAFTPPDSTLLVACVNTDTDISTNITVSVSDSLGGSWTQQIEADEGTEAAGGGGHSSSWTRLVTTGASMTVSVRRTTTGGGDNRVSCKVYVATGVDVGGTAVDTTGAANRGTSTTNNLTTDSVTPGATGLVFANGTDWNVLGIPTSSDLDGEDSPGTEDGATYASVSVVSGFKACTSGVGVTANLDAAGAAAADWQWTQIVAREAAITDTPQGRMAMTQRMG